jgi:hypothetical protein
MVSEKTSKLKLCLKLLLVTAVCLFFGFFRLNERYTFEWDQEDDAIKVLNLIQQKKPILIGPRVANANGFFVGPYHYYFLFPFYLLTKGDPIAGGVAAVVVSVITSITVYFIVRKIYDEKAALITGLLFASATSIISWNVMYTAFFGIIGFYLCLKIIDSQPKLFPILMLVYGLAATSHLVPASMGLSILIAIILSNKKISLKQLFIGLGLFLIPFIPLLVFDLRHDFLNTRKIIEFAFSDKTGGNSYPWWLFLRSFWRSLNLNTFAWDINSPSALIIIGNLLVIGIIIYEIFKLNFKQRILTSIWIITPLLILGFYKGGIPEYYYGLALVVVPILIGKSLSRLNLTIGTLILIFFVGIKAYKVIQFRPLINLENKKNVVEYIVNQKDDEYFNVSYDLGLGMNTGYGYLFKYYGKEPDSSPRGHLYTIVGLPGAEDDKVVFKSNNIGVIRR